MTLTEYTNQKSPQKLPAFFISIEHKDIKYIWPVNGGHNLQINILNDCFTYFVYASTRGLYTLDLKPSVFILSEIL